MCATEFYRNEASADPSGVAPGSRPDVVVSGPERAQKHADRPGSHADALAEAEGEGLTVAHVTGGGPTAGGFRYGPHSILSGRIDGRSAVARRMGRLAEQIARDMGFDDFSAMPAVRQAAVVQFCRTVAASDAFWSAFIETGRLPDKFWDLVSLTRRYAETLGLDRVMKDANPLDLAGRLAALHGQEPVRKS